MTELNDDILLRVIFTGLVQGVGFRRIVFRRAEEFQRLGQPIVGWVKNLEDGSVEAHIQGKKTICKKFIDSLNTESGSAKIEKINVVSLPVNFNYTNFKIN